MYRRNLRKFDQKYWVRPAGTAGNARGPAETRLDAFGGVKRKIAIGQFGEFSEDTHELVSDLATTGAERYCGEMLCSSPATAKGLLSYYVRSRILFAAVREQAWLLIDRLRDEIHGGAGQGFAAQAPPPRMPAPRRAREWAAAFGRGSFNASYSFGGAQRDGSFAYRSHA